MHLARKLLKVNINDNQCSATTNLLWSKPDGNITFVDFLIVIDPKYTETRLKNVNNKLGMDQKNSGLNLAPSFMEGKNMYQLYHVFKNLPIKSADKNLK